MPDLRRRFNKREVRFDVYLMQAVAQRLRGKGLPMIEFPQRVHKLTDASTNLYEIIKGRNLMVYSTTTGGWRSRFAWRSRRRAAGRSRRRRSRIKSTSGWRWRWLRSAGAGRAEARLRVGLPARRDRADVARERSCGEWCVRQSGLPETHARRWHLYGRRGLEFCSRLGSGRFSFDQPCDVFHRPDMSCDASLDRRRRL
jgi:hypothetical protein